MIIGGWRGPGWRVFDADLSRCKQVRDWIRGVVAAHPCPVDPDDAALVITELYANAVKHGPDGGSVMVGYCLWSGGARIVVADEGGTGAPRSRPAGELAEDGRGLHVVQAASTRWGSFRLDGAQVVWSDLGQPLRVPASDAWAWLVSLLTGSGVLGRARVPAGARQSAACWAPGECSPAWMRRPEPAGTSAARQQVASRAAATWEAG